LIADLREVHRKNYSVYVINEMLVEIKREVWDMGREQTRRLMCKAGLAWRAARHALIHHHHRPCCGPAS
jgi:hypothetical protein